MTRTNARTHTHTHTHPHRSKHTHTHTHTQRSQQEIDALEKGLLTETNHVSRREKILIILLLLQRKVRFNVYFIFLCITYMFFALGTIC